MTLILYTRIRQIFKIIFLKNKISLDNETVYSTFSS